MSEPTLSAAPSPSRLGLAPASPKPGRERPRPEPPADPPPAPPRTSRKKKPLTLGGWMIRAAMGLPLLVSAAVAFWCYQRLVPVQREAREAASQINRLSTEIGLMEGRLSAEELAKLAADYQRAQGLLFSTPETLKHWLTQLRLDMVPLALDAAAELGRPAITSSSNLAVAVVPATLSLTLQPSRDVEGTRTPYERVLRFLDSLAREEKRVDVVELHVTGGSNSVNRVVAALQLWAGEGGKP